MHPRLYRLFAGLLLSLFFGALPAPAESLDAMDAVLVRAGSLDKFLADAKLQDDYYQNLSAYYGGPQRAPRASFDAILAQLRTARAAAPALADRLWDTKGLGVAFRVEAAVRSSGLTLKLPEWNQYLGDLDSKLGADGRELSDLEPAAREKQLQKVLDSTNEKILAFESEIASLPKAERKKPSAEFFARLAEDGEFHAAGAYLLREKLAEEATRDLLHSGDADVVLSAWENLRAKSTFTGHERDVPERVRSLILRAHLPALSLPPLAMEADGPAETKIFRVTTRTTNRGKQVVAGSGASSFDSVPLPRRFHGIFKGLPTRECVGGACESLGALTPERWATVALADTQLYNIERNGSFLGFVQITPVDVKGARYGSIDFGAPALINTVAAESPAGLQTTSLYRLWLGAATEHLPKDWRGLVVGESRAIANAGVLDTVFQSPEYNFGPIVGKDARSPDPLATELIKIVEPKGYAESYAGNMITDGTVKEAGFLHLLTLQPVGLSAQLRDPALAREIMAGRSPIATAEQFAAWADRQKSVPSEITELLVDHLLNKPLAGANLKKLDHLLASPSWPRSRDQAALKAILTAHVIRDLSKQAINKLTDAVIADSAARAELRPLVLAELEQVGLSSSLSELLTGVFQPEDFASDTARLLRSGRASDRARAYQFVSMGFLNEDAEGALIDRMLSGNPWSTEAKRLRHAVDDLIYGRTHQFHLASLRRLVKALRSRSYGLRYVAVKIFSSQRNSEELTEFIPHFLRFLRHRPPTLLDGEFKTQFPQDLDSIGSILAKIKGPEAQAARNSLLENPPWHRAGFYHVFNFQMTDEDYLALARAERSPHRTVRETAAWMDSRMKGRDEMKLEEARARVAQESAAEASGSAAKPTGRSGPNLTDRCRSFFGGLHLPRPASF